MLTKQSFPHRMLAALVLLFVAGAAVPAASTDAPDEYGIKAALLYKFAKFVTWPESAFENDDAPFVLGVVGKDPFGNKLERTLADRTIGDRAIVIRRFAEHGKVGECHLLFVSASLADELPEIIQATRSRPLLLIGDTPRFAHRGGIVNLYRRGASIRFEINTDAAKRVKLTVDARLLQLARIVRD